MINTLMHSALGDFELRRYPRSKHEPLQAWDAADEYLLQYVAEQQLLGTTSRVLLLNDQFGALALPLADYKPVSWSDSWLAHQGVQANARDNGGIVSPQLLMSTQQPEGHFDLVIIKIPKTLAMLEHQLAALQGHLSANSVVLAGAMARHVHSSTLALFERYLGPTTTSLAKKKARLVFTTPSLALSGASPVSPYPDQFQWPGQPFKLQNHANVFSRSSLDIGARAMLEVVKELPSANNIVDLGCGNGVLGIAAQRQQPTARLHFVDESYMAVASASANWRAIVDQLGLDSPTADFTANDGLAGLALQSPELILCNPPFHQGSAVGDQTAWRMFRQSLSQLEPGGELWVVGNRHMAYHNKLQKLFGNCKLRYSNRKFVVLAAKKMA